MRYYCTYFDHHYLTRGLALYRSLRRHSGPFRLWVLCLSETCHSVLAKLALPEIELISLVEFEHHDAALHQARSNRSLIEYYFTCTPSLPRFVFHQCSEVDRVTYLDADLYFFNDPELVHAEIGDRSIAITPHRFSPALLHLTRYGIYNVGWVTFRRDPAGIECMEWWRERCLEWCHDRCEPARFGDQKYLDDWPVRFRNVKVLDHPGINLAPWNVANHTLGSDRRSVSIDGRSVIFYHFHGLKQVNAEMCDPGFSIYRIRPDPVLCRLIYAPYVRELRRAGRAAPGLNFFDIDIRYRSAATTAPRRVRHLLPPSMVELEIPELAVLRGELESTREALKACDKELHRLTRGVPFWIPPALTIALRTIKQHVHRLSRRIGGTDQCGGDSGC